MSLFLAWTIHIYVSLNTTSVFTRNVTVSIPIKVVVVKIEHCIVSMVTVTLIGRVGQEPILPVIITITQDNFDRHSEGHLGLKCKH